jgi:hypothetical protein
VKLKIEIDIGREGKFHKGLPSAAYALRQLDNELCEGSGDIVDGIRLGMRARKRLLDPDGNTIGFADITD